MIYNTSDYKEVKSLKETWSEWLNRYNWDWYVTLTFRHPVSAKVAHHLWCKWIRALEKQLDDGVGYFRVSEIQRGRQILHYHALMLNVRRLRRLTWMDRWYQISGIARIFAYDYQRGANFYLSKYITKELSDYQISGKILQT